MEERVPHSCGGTWEAVAHWDQKIWGLWVADLEGDWDGKHKGEVVCCRMILMGSSWQFLDPGLDTCADQEGVYSPAVDAQLHEVPVLEDPGGFQVVLPQLFLPECGKFLPSWSNVSTSDSSWYDLLR